jgi:hypothetical protein
MTRGRRRVWVADCSRQGNLVRGTRVVHSHHNSRTITSRAGRRGRGTNSNHHCVRLAGASRRHTKDRSRGRR